MHELDHLLAVSREGLVTHTDGAALNNNIEEWFDNPEHTIADNPAWGHNLKPLLFEPPSDDLAVAIEMSIQEKLSRDVTGITIKAIRVDWPSIDSCRVVLLHQHGTFATQLSSLPS